MKMKRKIIRMKRKIMKRKIMKMKIMRMKIMRMKRRLGNRFR
jgi:hypothetical protein